MSRSPAKRLSLYGVNLKDALRVALNTPTAEGTKRAKVKAKKAAKRKVAKKAK